MADVPSTQPLAALGMTGPRPGLLAGAWHVARSRARRARLQPRPLPVHPLDPASDPRLEPAPGRLSRHAAPDHLRAASPCAAMTQLATCVCLLLLLYTVESLERERIDAAGGDQLTPPRSAPARSFWARPRRWPRSGLAIVLAAGLAGLIAILIQGRVPFELRPIVLVWGLLLFPTFLVWTCFVIAVQTITRNRYTTYAVGLAVLAFTGYRLLTDEINWVGNWPLWDAVRWSDISVLELDRRALVLSRVLAVGLAVFFLALTVRFFRRREADPTRIIHRLRPQALARHRAAAGPLGARPARRRHLAGARGGLGARGRRRPRNRPRITGARTWRRIATRSVPDITHVDLDLELFPGAGRLPRLGDLRPGQRLRPAASRDPPDRRASTGKTSPGRSTTSHTPRPTARRLYVFTPAQASRARPDGTDRLPPRGDRSPRHQQERGRQPWSSSFPRAWCSPASARASCPSSGSVDEIGVEDDNRIRRQGIRRRLLQGADRLASWERGRRSRPASRSPAPPISRSTRWGSRPRRR